MSNHAQPIQPIINSPEFIPEVFLASLLDPLLKLPPRRCNREVSRLGKILAQKINRQRGDFSVSYLKGAHTGDLTIGKPLRDALLVHSIGVERGCPVKPILVEVTILTYPGQVEKGSIVKAESRRCRECHDPFVPVVWNDNHCSKICAAKGKRARENQTFVGMMKTFFGGKS